MLRAVLCIVLLGERLFALHVFSGSKVLERASFMNERARNGVQFNDEVIDAHSLTHSLAHLLTQSFTHSLTKEVDCVIQSFKNLKADIDYSRLTDFIVSSAHVSFKDNYLVCSLICT